MIQPSISLRAMRSDDYTECLPLWQQDGVVLREWENQIAVRRLIVRNPYLSQVAIHDQSVIGAILAANDGWRGFFYHLAVAPGFQGMGVGRQLARAATRQMSEQGIYRIHVCMVQDNARARQFWSKLGWQLRDEICTFSIDTTIEPHGSTV